MMYDLTLMWVLNCCKYSESYTCKEIKKCEEDIIKQKKKEN